MVIDLDKLEGLIIKQISFKESSKIVYLYTPSGQVSILVHGAKKYSSPFLRLTENLTLIRCFVTGSGLKTMTEGEIVRDYADIKSDLEKMTYVSHLTELLMAFSESEYDHKKIYEFFVKILNHIETSKAYIRFVYMFELKYLYMLGVAPNFKQCVDCTRTDDLHFSIKNGGYACPDHVITGEKTIPETTMSVIKQLYYHDLKLPLELKIDQQTGMEIRRFLDEYYVYHLSFQSKSRKILAGLLGY